MKRFLLALSSISLFLFATPAFAQGDIDDAAGGAFGLFFLCCWGIFALVMLGLLVLWVLMLIDCIKRPDDKFPNPSDNTKVIWIVLLVLFSYLAAIFYYFMVKKKIPL